MASHLPMQAPKSPVAPKSPMAPPVMPMGSLTSSEGHDGETSVKLEKSTWSGVLLTARSSYQEVVKGASNLADYAMKPTGPPKTRLGQTFPKIDAFVRSPRFEALVAIVIFVNSVTIGVEVNAMVDYPDEWIVTALIVFEHLFTAFFFSEFWLRMAFFGWQIYVPMKEGVVSRGDACSNLMDAFLVWFTGVLFVWVLAPLNVDLSSFRVLTAFRAFRLFRFVRVVRKVPIFKEVVLLISGLADSARTLFWTIVVLLFITYIFAVFGVVLISAEISESHATATSSEDIDTLAQLLTEIGGVDNLMYTLIQLLTLDSWNAIARPLVSYLGWTWLFWYAYIAVAVIVLMNLVTAVIVENALASSAKDIERQLQQKEAEEAKAFERFQEIFQMIDADGDGTVRADEFHAAMEKPQVTNQLLLLDFQPEDCQMIFDLLDGGDGELSLDEFFGGLSQMKGAAQAKGTFVLEKRLEQMTAALQQLSVEVSEDSRLLSDKLSVKLPDREGSILTRVKKKSAAQQPASSTPTASHSPRGIMQPHARALPGGMSHASPYRSNSIGQRSTPPCTPSAKPAPPVVDLGSRMDKLASGMESFMRDVSSQMIRLSSRLDSIERDTTHAATKLAEFTSTPALPSEWRRKHPVMRSNAGKPLYTPCEGLTLFRPQ